jgi:hypothetical protein
MGLAIAQATKVDSIKAATTLQTIFISLLVWLESQSASSNWFEVDRNNKRMYAHD